MNVGVKLLSANMVLSFICYLRVELVGCVAIVQELPLGNSQTVFQRSCSGITFR
jgi:hypothetical protein